MEDIDEEEEAQLLDSIRWEMDNVQFIPEDPEKEELIKLHKYYQNIIRIIDDRRSSTERPLQREWNILRKIAGRKNNEVENGLRNCNIEKRRRATNKSIGDKVISHVIGILKDHGWTVEPPPERNEK